MTDDNSIDAALVKAVAADRLNNVLTGIAVKAGLLRTRFQDPDAQPELQELERLAIEAVALLRQAVPSA